MNDTDETSGSFDRDNVRTLSAARRASDDRIVAGVCAGVARHLNIDPIVVRIAVVALTFIGLSGLILYLAAWFLLPSDDEDASIAADWFNLDRNEEQVRAIGLFLAAVLAVVAIVGDGGWGFWWIGWWVVPVAFLFWLFVVRPRRRREEQVAMATAPGTPVTAQEHVDAYTAEKVAAALDRKRRRAENRREARALTGLTLSLIAIAEAATLIVDRTTGVPPAAYPAVAVGVIAVGCLIGTMWGRLSGGLIALGILATAVLAITSAAPSGPIGDHSAQPQTVREVHHQYRHGIGQFSLDLSGVANARGLAGKTVVVDTGVGQTQVWVPDDVPVDLAVTLRGGEIVAFGRTWHGSDNDIRLTDGKGKPLHLVINQRFGDVEVNRR
ncbi:MAG TPA: PspC domain-containing protein [Aeromicrobium sp.]|nr:PspC domain-containing protein [Aeromicrobium sp.]